MQGTYAKEITLARRLCYALLNRLDSGFRLHRGEKISLIGDDSYVMIIAVSFLLAPRLNRFSYLNKKKPDWLRSIEKRLRKVESLCSSLIEAKKLGEPCSGVVILGKTEPKDAKRLQKSILPARLVILLPEATPPPRHKGQFFLGYDSVYLEEYVDPPMEMLMQASGLLLANLKQPPSELNVAKAMYRVAFFEPVVDYDDPNVFYPALGFLAYPHLLRRQRINGESLRLLPLFAKPELYGAAREELFDLSSPLRKLAAFEHERWMVRSALLHPEEGKPAYFVPYSALLKRFRGSLAKSKLGEDLLISDALVPLGYFYFRAPRKKG